MLIGLLVGGYLGDKFGRKFTINVGITMSLVFGFLSAISRNYL